MAAPSRKPRSPSRPARALHSHVKNHFIPHKGNDYVPHALRHRALIGYSVFLILFKCAAFLIPVLLPFSHVFSSAITRNNIVELTNSNRKNLGLGELKQNQKLNLAAQVKANDLLEQQYFAHTSPSGMNALGLMRLYGYQPLYGGENLAVHFTTAEETSDSWMASPGHRANIVNPYFKEIGIGISEGTFEGVPTTFVVQLFGTPKFSAENTRTAEKVAPAATTTDAPPSSMDKAKIKPTRDGLAVRLVSQKAKNVKVLVGSKVQDLQPPAQGSDEWTGTVPLATAEMNTSGEQIQALVTDQEGSVSATSLGILSPGSDARDIFLFQQQEMPEVRLFGLFDIHVLNDSARKTYLSFIAFLSTALLLNIFVKIRIQRLSVIAHTVGVIGLAAFLLVL